MTDHHKQLEFNFKRGAKLAIINKIMRRNVFNSRMLLALRAIDDCARDQPLVTMTYNEIAAFLHMSRATAKRGVADLIQYDLLGKTPVVNSQGKQANEYQLIWSNLQSVADGEPLETPAPDSEYTAVDDSETSAPDRDYELSQVVISATGQIEADPGHHDPSDGSHRPPDPGHRDPSLLIPLSRINNPPPSNKPTWEEVEQILFSEGVGCAAKAAQTACDRGCHPGEILLLVKFSRSKPGAYGPGAIYKRVSEAIPGSNPATGWARESKEFRQKQSQAKLKTKANQTAQLAAKREAKKLRDQYAQEILEREFGPELDRMDRYELRMFAAAHLGDAFAGSLARDPDAHRSSGFSRAVLLKALKDQATGLPGNSKTTDAEGLASVD